MSYRLLYIAIVLFLASCQKKGCELPDDIEDIPVDVKIDRLEKDFFAIDNEKQVRSFLQEEPLFANKFLQQNQYPHDSILVNSLLGLATNPSLDSLAQQAVKKFGDMTEEEKQLETAFKVIKYHYPDFKEPEVKTFVSGLSQDLMVSDSLIVFGIDYFIGKDAMYRPDTYDYILKRYERPNMVPAAILLLSNRFNKTDFLDRSMLSEMINAGKAYYFVQTAMPCTPDSTIIGYSGQQIADVHHNEGKIWAHFIEKSLLYEKNPFQVQKYMGERPSTPEIDATAPGRLGAWVGWQIVRKYMERNPEVSLPELMADKDFKKIFNESKYKPEKR
ncbi:gliding motility lipoprotein GldB [Pontibacter sp. KCTC 32443]|uniref:gliding motility lipoprotein GldB n=1 Tax=Pontibacter TaxID=323449 RepID=UPI00164D2326|nr:MULTISPECIES: gliding motility lipoprotein GldB [Pontibacter]MBC5775914.1 gliding motility lipoprotein GldB [Pontibacter sp. KCTC 32443]